MKSQGRYILLGFTMMVLYHATSFAHGFPARLIDSDQGLSNNEINVVFQDSNGFLWLGTDDGLNRYDSYEFAVFRHDNFDSTSIASGMIHDILEDAEGNIWVATNGGVSRYDPLENEFLNISFQAELFGKFRNQTFKIVFDSEQNLWCLQKDRVLKYDIPSNTFIDYPLYSLSASNELSHSKAMHFCKRSKTLFIGTEKGLGYISGNAGGLRVVSGINAGVNFIEEDESHKVWVGTVNGLYILADSISVESEAHLTHRLKGLELRAMYFIENNELLVLGKNTVYETDRLSWNIQELTILKMHGSVPLKEIRSSLLDKADNLWIGTRHGLYYTNLIPPDFRFYNTDPESEVMLAGKRVSSVLQDGERIYLGTWDRGFEVIEKGSVATVLYSNTEPSRYFPEEGVNCIHKDQSNRIWVASSGLYHFNENSGSFTTVADYLSFPELTEIRGSRIHVIGELSDHELLLGHSRGLYYINEEEHEFRLDTVLSCDSVLIPISDVTDIVIDSSEIWLAFRSGIFMIDRAGDENVFYPSEEVCGYSIEVLTLKKDSKGIIWAGTPSGLYKFNKGKAVFECYSLEFGNVNDFIYSIEEDEKGTLWLGTNKGIINLDPLNRSFRNYGIKHGLSCMEFNLNASSYIQGGKMYFGSIEGLNFFDPDSLINASKENETMISGIKYFHGDYERFYSFNNKTIKLSDRASVQVFFTELDYIMPEYHEYKYRLLNARGKGQWIDIGKENSLILSGLDHGRYELRVVGDGSDGNTNSAGAILNIFVKAPFYRRNIFIFLMFLPLLALFYFLFEYRTKTLRSSNRALREKEITAKEVLKQKNLLSRRNKNIEDSLKYAQRIQFAMFTSASEIKKMFPNSFILQKPKDIVSGDFYWAKKINEKIFLAVADCTGHGVPGAFMSLIGLEFFRQIIGVKNVHTPSKILDEINRNFDLVFDNIAEIELRDGMDLALVVIDTNTNKLQYSGAFNPLYIVRNSEIVEIKADRNILGPDLGFERPPFTNHEIQLEEDDVVYLFSDGYADQFGGPEGKKFKYRRFRHLLLSVCEQPMDIQRQILENSITDWMGNHEQVDDILVMGVKPVTKTKRSMFT